MADGFSALGVMESQTANQLPEANTLPDGFVDSSTEDLAPLTPNVEQEKPHGDYKEEGFAGLGDSSESRHEFASKEFQTSEGRTEKTQKLRTFPVPLSEMDNSHASVDLAEVPSKGSVEHRESAVINPNSAAVSEASAGASGCSIEERSEAQGINKKDVSVSESDDTLKNRKPTHIARVLVKRFQCRCSRSMAVRDKLESLCRELQRQNKMLMDECKRVSSEGQNLRLDLSAKFQDAIKDVSIKLEEQKDDCLSQLKENEMLRTNLKQLADQYALTEQQYAQKLKQKTLELQIGELKIKQHEEKLVQEQSQMKLYAEQVSQLLATEKNLRLQLTADGEKFQQFQDALVKSNEVFETFKQEIEKMAKSIKELKKENAFLKSKCEKSDFTLIELVEERERMKKQLEKSKNQKEKLESLCRSLQAERKQNSVGSNNSDSAPE
ncbi:alpha-taxilin-like protein [Citrus sinensis]|nr:alpha-taxilin-like protein [Citrus sinensis]